MLRKQVVFLHLIVKKSSWILHLVLSRQVKLSSFKGKERSLKLPVQLPQKASSGVPGLLK